jgi:putative Mg2+ transporter-C (MgtC) family protein
MIFGDMVLKLFVSILLGSLIGLERETHGRPAGLRTHVLVCMGSTLFTIAGIVMAGPQRTIGAINDPARIAAQIVTGIGFLGAGTIIHQGSVVRGLTTAASIWAVAAIGIMVGIGGDMMWLAGVASVMVFGTLYLMGRIDKYLVAAPDERRLTITTTRNPERIYDIMHIFAEHNARLRSVDSRAGDESDIQVIRMRLIVARDFDETKLASDLTSSKSVISYSWE